MSNIYSSHLVFECIKYAYPRTNFNNFIYFLLSILVCGYTMFERVHSFRFFGFWMKNNESYMRFPVVCARESQKHISFSYEGIVHIYLYGSVICKTIRRPRQYRGFFSYFISRLHNFNSKNT